MNIRYSLIPYTYTLFHLAHQAGETVLRALAWEFPNDPQLAGVETQFMSGPALLVTPVLAPLATTVQGVFPGVAEGTRWYDWYTHGEVKAAPGENKTLEAPLLHQPIHIRGGYIVPIQKAGNTTKTSRLNPWSLIIALDKHGRAVGDLYLDDGINIEQEATKEIHVSAGHMLLEDRKLTDLRSCLMRTVYSTPPSLVTSTTTCRSPMSPFSVRRAIVVKLMVAMVQTRPMRRAELRPTPETTHCTLQVLRAPLKTVFGVVTGTLLWFEYGNETKRQLVIGMSSRLLSMIGLVDLEYFSNSSNVKTQG